MGHFWIWIMVSKPITFRLVNNITLYHIKEIENKNKRFCTHKPYLINVNIGPKFKVLLCDGEYIMDITDWSGIGMSMTSEVEPSKRVRSLVEQYLFF